MNSIYYYFLIGLLYLIPILFGANKNLVFVNFSFLRLLKSINKALIFQIILWVCFAVINFILDKYNIRIGSKNSMLDFLIYTLTFYVMFGFYFYFPTILIINIFSFLCKLISYLIKMRSGNT